MMRALRLGLQLLTAITVVVLVLLACFVFPH